MKRNLFLTASIAALFFFTYTLSAQTSKTFKVVNKTGNPVTSVRMSKSNANEWGLELNTMEKVPNGSSFEFGTKIDAAMCKYDVKFVSADGVEYYMKDVDLCQIKEIVLVMPDDNQGKSEEPGMKTEDKTKSTEEKPGMNTGDGNTGDVNTDVKSETPPEQKTEPPKKEK